MADPGFKVEFNEQDKRRILELLDDIIDYRRAVWRGLNLGARRGRKLAVDEIGSKLTLPKKHIRQAVKVKQRASAKHVVASFEVSGAPVSLSLYKSRVGKKSTKFQIYRDGPQEEYLHTFKLMRGNGSKGRIVERNLKHSRYDGRLPVREKFGPSIPNAFDKTPGLAQKAMEKAMADAMVEIERQVQLVLDGKI